MFHIYIHISEYWLCLLAIVSLTNKNGQKLLLFKLIHSPLKIVMHTTMKINYT